MFVILSSESDVMFVLHNSWALEIILSGVIIFPDYLNNIHKKGDIVHTIYVADYFGDVGFMQGKNRYRKLSTKAECIATIYKMSKLPCLMISVLYLTSIESYTSRVDNV